jgi:hypothetical protein
MRFTQKRRLVMTTEDSPLEFDVGRASYSTFSYRSQGGSVPYWFSVLTKIFQYSNSSDKTTEFMKWTGLGAILLIILVHIQRVSRSGDSLFVLPGDQWDHNHYNDIEKRDVIHNPERNLLIVQVSGSQSHSWSDITSLPNRAYARKWSIDFLLHYSDRTCSRQARFLWELYQRQQREAKEPNPSSQPRVVYDSVLFLSPDAIITDLVGPCTPCFSQGVTEKRIGRAHHSLQSIYRTITFYPCCQRRIF